ncbi:MAG: permease prefix domain 1-containing protein [Actinomycetia bacterium]|nr:permease prefix domain 1-containing protein [Actinomycetes bacterium]
MARVTRFIWPRRYAREVRAELSDHMAACVESLIAQGWSEAEATEEAMNRFGSSDMLARSWANVSYGSIMRPESGMGALLGLLVASEPWWMGATGPFLADALLLTGAGILGLGLSRLIRFLRAGAWTACRSAGFSFVGMFGAVVVIGAVLAFHWHPSHPPGYADWYGPDYWRHALLAVATCTGLVLTPLIWATHLARRPRSLDTFLPHEPPLI